MEFMSNLYVVRYIGPFGFIKPWTAVRDGETYSQQFLTPSIVEGMRQKLAVVSIARHRLSHQGFSRQQEAVQSAGFKENTRERTLTRKTGILIRGLLLNPVLHLAFHRSDDAKTAAMQHICLCRNEDVLYPSHLPRCMSEEDFDEIPGFELLPADDSHSFMVGYNRYRDGAPMYGRLLMFGNPTFVEPIEL